MSWFFRSSRCLPGTCYFPFFIICICINPLIISKKYGHEKKKIKFKPRIKLNHNITTPRKQPLSLCFLGSCLLDVWLYIFLTLIRFDFILHLLFSCFCTWLWCKDNLYFSVWPLRVCWQIQGPCNSTFSISPVASPDRKFTWTHYTTGTGSSWKLWWVYC